MKQRKIAVSNIIEFKSKPKSDDTGTIKKTGIISFNNSTEEHEEVTEPLDTTDLLAKVEELSKEAVMAGKKPVSALTFAMACMQASYGYPGLRITSIGVTNEGQYRIYCLDEAGNNGVFDVPAWEDYYE